MKNRLLVYSLLLLAITGPSNAANFEGSTIKIVGTYNTTGRVPSPSYSLDTTAHFGPNNQLEIAAAGRNFHAPLNGSSTPNAAEHHMRCGGVLVGVDKQPDYIKAKFDDGILTFSILIDWSGRIRSSKCAGGVIASKKSLNQEFVVNLKNGCKFQYSMKSVANDKVTADLQIEGECELIH